MFFIFLLTIRRWVRLSWQHYAELAHSEEAGDAGIQIISGYQYFNNYREVRNYTNSHLYSTSLVTYQIFISLIILINKFGFY